MTDLTNENLFPISKVRFAEKSPGLYDELKPAFLLASRMILYIPQSYAMVIKRIEREILKGDYVGEDDIVQRDAEDIINIIRSFIPHIDIDPDMSARSEEYAMTYLDPSQEHDLVVLDAKLIKAITDPCTTRCRKTAALFTIALLVCHEIAHILEFRSVQKGVLDPSGKPFESPPGLTCADAGSAWEYNVFNGVISPICYTEGDLSTILGLSARSQFWNGNFMAISNQWISELFLETFWISTNSLRPPYQPILSVSARCGPSSLDDEESEENLSSKKRRRGGKRGDISRESSRKV